MTDYYLYKLHEFGYDYTNQEEISFKLMDKAKKFQKEKLDEHENEVNEFIKNNKENKFVLYKNVDINLFFFFLYLIKLNWFPVRLTEAFLFEPIIKNKKVQNIISSIKKYGLRVENEELQDILNKNLLNRNYILHHIIYLITYKNDNKELDFDYSCRIKVMYGTIGRIFILSLKQYLVDKKTELDDKYLKTIEDNISKISKLFKNIDYYNFGNYNDTLEFLSDDFIDYKNEITKTIEYIEKSMKINKIINDNAIKQFPTMLEITEIIENYINRIMINLAENNEIAFEGTIDEFKDFLKKGFKKKLEQEIKKVEEYGLSKRRIELYTEDLRKKIEYVENIKTLQDVNEFIKKEKKNFGRRINLFEIEDTFQYIVDDDESLMEWENASYDECFSLVKMYENYITK